MLTQNEFETYVFDITLKTNEPNSFHDLLFTLSKFVYSTEHLKKLLLVKRL